MTISRKTPTSAERKARIVAHIRSQGTWVSVRAISLWMKRELLSYQSLGNQDLRALVARGVLERRPTREHPIFPAYEYRVRA